MWAADRTHHYDLNMIMWRYVDVKTPEEESPFVQNKSEFMEVLIYGFERCEYTVSRNKKPLS